MFHLIKRYWRARFSHDRDFYRIIRQTLGIVPDNIELYKLAFIHRSASITLDDGRAANNERLEFLGDAVLEAIVSEFIFIEYREEPEGFLTQMRSRIVSRASLDEIARAIGLDRLIVANFNGTYSHKHLPGNVLEALIGAIYLDKGYDFTNRIVINNILRNYVSMDDIAITESDFKSRLIEWCQKSKREIRFETSHDTDSTMQHPRFRSTIIIDGIELGHGHGTSKKEAEQKAAFTVTQLVSDEIGDYFLDSIDISVEQYAERNGKVN